MAGAGGAERYQSLRSGPGRLPAHIDRARVRGSGHRQLRQRPERCQLATSVGGRPLHLAAKHHCYWICSCRGIGKLQFSSLHHLIIEQKARLLEQPRITIGYLDNVFITAISPGPRTLQLCIHVPLYKPFTYKHYISKEQAGCLLSNFNALTQLRRWSGRHLPLHGAHPLHGDSCSGGSWPMCSGRCPSNSPGGGALGWSRSVHRGARRRTNLTKTRPDVMHENRGRQIERTQVMMQ